MCSGGLALSLSARGGDNHGRGEEIPGPCAARVGALHRGIETAAVAPAEPPGREPSAPRAGGGVDQLPGGVLQKLVDIALELCQGHSAGISLLEEGPPGHLSPRGDHFRWHAVAGKWAPLIWNTTTRRDFGPCGTVLDRNSTLLFTNAHRHYTQFAGVEPLLIEGLLVPFHVNEQAVGTVWVVAHDDSRKFDGEDQRLLESLATFAATAYQARSSLSAQAKANRELQEEIAERKRAQEALRESERRFREMIDELPVAIYTTDAQGRLTHFNPACVEFSGRVPNLGSDHWCVTWKLYYPDGRRCRTMNVRWRSRSRRAAWSTGLKPSPSGLTAPASGSRPILLRCRQRRQDHRRHQHAGGHHRAQATEEAGAYLAAIVESSDDAIITKGLDGVITTWNAERTPVRLHAQEAIGQPITMLIPPDRRDEEPRIIEQPPAWRAH